MSEHRDENSEDNDRLPKCLNCKATLHGQYCASCGQRSTSRLISLWQLMKEAFGDLFEADSRLWQTLRPLMLSPGLLTKDYLLGRRARYMPPFRMYLVLSVVFFVVAAFNPREDFALFFDGSSDLAANQTEDRSEDESQDENDRPTESVADDSIDTEKIAAAARPEIA